VAPAVTLGFGDDSDTQASIGAAGEERTRRQFSAIFARGSTRSQPLRDGVERLGAGRQRGIIQPAGRAGGRPPAACHGVMMSSIIPRLFGIYRAAGHEPLTGYSPFHFFNVRDVSFTIFLKDSRIWGCPGVALQEVMFFERFRDYIAPKRVLVIGNAFGWSTLALALIFPEAKTVAIDPDVEGVNFTNELITKNNLTARAVVGRSPQDVAAVVEQHLGGPLDFALIDAVHTNEAVTADFAAVKKAAADGAFYLFHDVINWNMIEGFNAILAKYALKGKVFTRTPSGMALAYSQMPPAFESYLNCFTEPAGVFATLRNVALANGADPIPSFRDFSMSKR
jgi:Methyltransferase domain